jgi:hypothetical protein
VKKHKLIIARYNENLDWISNLDSNKFDFEIYNKGDNNIKFPHTKVNNIGRESQTFIKYIVDNYNNLYDFTAFLQGNPFDHCKLETFNKLIFKKEFTPLEDYSDYPEYYAHKKDVDGGYMEINNNWYIPHLISVYGQYSNKYFTSFNEFLSIMFENPQYSNWIRFSPGGQYLVPKENILFYSKSFYEKLLMFVNYSECPVEAFTIERASYYIFSNKWKEK